MTVTAAILVPGHGCVLGCDSRVTAGYGIVTDACVKYVVAGSAICLVSGHDGSLMDYIASARNIEGVRLIASEYTDGRNLSWDLLCYDRKLERLVVIDSHGSAIPVGAYHTSGSGGDVALGVLSSSPPPQTLEAGKRLIRKACGLAARHNAACGGKVRVLTVEGGRKKVEIS